MNTIMLTRNYSHDEELKESVTIPKDLCSQVQHCLSLMTSFFKQFNSEYDQKNNINQLCHKKWSQPKSTSVTRSSVKQRLFDENWTHSNVPKGQVVEKLFVRQRSTGSSVELASRQTYFNNRSTNRILDQHDVLASSEQCSSTSSRSDESTNRKTTVSKTSQVSWEPQSSSEGVDASQLLLKKKGKPRYRLVRRHCSKIQRSTSDEDKSKEHPHLAGKEIDSTEVTDTTNHRYLKRNEHSLEQCLNNTNDLKKTKAAVKSNKRRLYCSSPEMDDVILVEAPTKSPQEIPIKISQYTSSPNSLRMDRGEISLNKTPLIFGGSDPHCLSSTPRKPPHHNNTKPQQDEGNTFKEAMPSPIRSIVTKTSENHPTLINNLDQASNSILQKGSLPRPTTNIQSSQNRHGYFRKMFLGSPEKNFSGSLCSLSLPTISLDDPSLQTVEQDSLSEQRYNSNNRHQTLTGRNGVPTNLTSSASPEVTCRKEKFSGHKKSKSSRKVCAMNERRYKRKLEHNSESGSTTESANVEYQGKPEVITSKKLNKHCYNFDSFTRPKRSPKRAKFHPYATSNKFPITPSETSPYQRLRVKSPSLISPLRDLTIKSPSSPQNHKWTTLSRSPMTISVKQPRRNSDQVVKSRKLLGFDFHNPTPDNQESSNCSNGKCSKTFCFDCSMHFS